MSSNPSTTVSIQKEEDLFVASRRIFSEGLFDPDFETSRIQGLMDTDLMDTDLMESSRVSGVWFATQSIEPKDVGVAIVSAPERDSNGLLVLNMFVADHAQKRGIGSALLDEVFKTHPPSSLAAHYTIPAARLYHRFGLAPAEIRLTDVTQPLLQSGKIQEAGNIHVQAVLEEAQKTAVRHSRPRRSPSP